MATNTTDPADDLPPEMDYKMHKATFDGFISFTKYSIVAMVFVVLSLYCFIEAGQPLLGVLLLLLAPVVAIAMAVMGRRSAY